VCTALTISLLCSKTDWDETKEKRIGQHNIHTARFDRSSASKTVARAPSRGAPFEIPNLSRKRRKKTPLSKYKKQISRRRRKTRPR